MRDRVRICEVGPRDGLQMIDGFVPTAEKIAWIEMEAAAGVPEIEVTSLVPAHVMPQFADAGEVLAASRAVPNLTVSVLVPNVKGAQRALAAGVSTIDFVMSASKTFSQRNLRRDPETSLRDFTEIVELCAAEPAQTRPRLKAGISASFGCAYEGRVPPSDVIGYACSLLSAGADELLVADTVGYGDPASVRALCDAVVKEAGDVPVGAHFHDTRGTGLANVVGALESGVRIFDASLAGLGGCPFAPGAAGNIATEDVVFMLNAMGMDTGIDLERLLRARDVPARNVPPDQLNGKVAKAGLPIHCARSEAGVDATAR